jgi:hypothetical protein
VIFAAFELLAGGVTRLLGALGFERFVEGVEAKHDPRNFKPPHDAIEL